MAPLPGSSQPRHSVGAKFAMALLLLLPYAGLCFPQLYARQTPALFGFPFFYWYQLAWVFIATAILGLVYMLRRD